MVTKPKTIKDIQVNTRVLRGLNKNHKDDIFVTHQQKYSAKVFYYQFNFAKCKYSIFSPLWPYMTHCITFQEVKQGPQDILEDLFDSDSENDLSLHSARTPIGRFFDRSEVKTPAIDREGNSNDDMYHAFSKKDE